ncbi:RagB/SusD family nutrient uptake outer membrane protein [Chitinophaga rhizophila]|uniref:RagB/SusD family nutrient uptake outer membrane protein n=1 Tax=Chitinophaga rhizophila TaxID=2866212 RepID=A0ABS7GJY3_9BACT|nr:RagB/SusD family nutrient uptake outer membrane protein [Chitinophaga rhizophila]MBW8688024.1 RagB/SusD family nutrient uptake outer membrane protein [Chitinophaga rhizophila]
MKRITKIATYAALALLPVFASSCTDLTENVYDQIITDDFYNNKDEVVSAVLRPYTHANAWVTPGQNGWWRLSELSADQLAWPQKGRHGYDGGNWIRLHYHSWLVDDGPIADCWYLLWTGIGFCTTAIENIEKRDAGSMGITQAEKDAYVSDLRLFRAFHYLRVMDLWGNVPIVTQIGNPINPPTAERKDVFNFIEKEILDHIDAAPVLSKSFIGRMSKASAYAMLVELYLNAEKWTGTPRWDDCIAASNKLINGEAGGMNGALALDPNITDTYKPTNHLSKEIIFSIAYDFQVSNFTPQWTGDFYHFNQGLINGNDRNGNDGVVVIPGVYTTFDDTDKRKKEWISEGPQWKYGTNNTEPVIASGGNEYNGEQLVFVDNIRKNKLGSTLSDMTQGEENSGVRFNKYKLGPITDPNYRSTDWAVYRLTWVYFAKAEALMRKNNGAATQEAVDLVNTCKQRAYDAEVWETKKYTTATLTMDELLAELGREFIFEGYRRQELIRWGKFTTASWWDHKPSESFRELFAIPYAQRALNVNLKQNPGYPN